MTPTDKLLLRCDRCGKRYAHVHRWSISIINTEPDHISEGNHASDVELTLCYGCVGLAKIELDHFARRIREGCYA